MVVNMNKKEMYFKVNKKLTMIKKLAFSMTQKPLNILFLKHQMEGVVKVPLQLRKSAAFYIAEITLFWHLKF
jgi:hypothetical protein